jgi:hypothetical protein
MMESKMVGWFLEIPRVEPPRRQGHGEGEEREISDFGSLFSPFSSPRSLGETWRLGGSIPRIFVTTYENPVHHPESIMS